MRISTTSLLLLSLVACRDDGGADTQKGGSNDSGSASGQDADGDGWDSPADCDDANAAIYPGAAEICDGADNDCDTLVDEDASDAATWYGDADRDGYGGDQFVVEACDAPDGYAPDGGDCNDLDADSHPGADEVCDGSDNDCDGELDEDDAIDTYTWYLDEDGDGWGVSSATVEGCDAPREYVAHDGDCDDDDPSFHPGAAEADCSDANDYNCDGSVGYADADQDGFAACEDCDDAEASANPDGVEVCDGVDNDCDGSIDDDATDDLTWYADADGDGFGSSQTSVEQCDTPAGYVSDDTDCDDLDAASYPGGAEVCDDADNDCDGDVDEGVGTTWYADVDGDGYGNAASTAEACDAPVAYVANGNDCDDTSASTSPASYEICDGVDNDCDGDVDEAGALNGSTFYRDTDQDGYGVSSDSVQDCVAPSGYVEDAGDCNDADVSVSPAATEVCDSIDNNCDGDTDEDSASDASTWYRDADQDGYGVSALTETACTQPSGYVTDGTDCDDTNQGAHPGATEFCDNVDNNCDGTVDEDSASDALIWYADADGDGFGDSSTSTSACSQPSGYVSDGTDCDDTPGSGTAINTSASETCDGIDNNCSGAADDDASVLGVAETCAATDCQAVLTARSTAATGDYWIDPDTSGAFETHCEMDTQGGGWTLVMNVEPSDGNNVIYSNTTFWQSDSEYGSYGSHFTNDYKGPAAWKLTGTSILVQVADPGATGSVFGWKAWSMSSKTYDSFFHSGNNTTQTVSLLGQDIASVYAYEPLLRQGSHLRSNMEVNANGDRSRLSAESYSPQGDDNQPGLGTQMNGNCCGDDHRNKDVELWVNSSSNLWCTPPSEGSYAWLGSDGTCGGSCSSCDSAAGPGYTPYWTYRIYVR